MDIQKPKHNYAYIDDANLYHGIAKLGWKIDYDRFRVWLSEKYDVKVAYIFTGFISSYKERYEKLEQAGFKLIHKRIVRGEYGKIKGNCDAELVLQAVHDMHKDRFGQSIIVSSDGDFSCLAKFLNNRKKLHTIISPSNKCSFLLRILNVPLLYLDTQRKLLEVTSIKEKALDGDGTP